MLKSVTKEMINGAMKLIVKTTYKDGSSSKRIMNPKTMIPESVVFIDAYGNKKEESYA